MFGTPRQFLALDFLPKPRGMNFAPRLTWGEGIGVITFTEHCHTVRLCKRLRGDYHVRSFGSGGQRFLHRNHAAAPRQVKRVSGADRLTGLEVVDYPTEGAGSKVF